MRGSLQRILRFWSNRSLRAKSLAVMAIPVLALVLTAGLLYRVNRSHDRAAAEMQRAEEVHIHVQHVTLLMIQVDAATRIYVQTELPEYREPYRQAQAALQAEIRVLQALMPPTPAMKERAHLVGQSAAGLLNDAAQLMEQTPDSPAARAESLAKLRNQTDALFREVNTLEADWAQLITRQSTRREQANRRHLAEILAIELGGLIGGLGAVLLFSSGLINQVGRMAENARRLAAQRPLLPFDVGDDEIGALSKALVAAADMLVQRDRRLDLALLGSGAVIWEADLATGRLELLGNAEGQVLIGLTPDVLPRTVETWIEMIDPEFRSDVVKTVGDAARAGGSFHVEYPVRLPKGQERWVESRGQTFVGPDSAPRLLGVMLDVTGRRQNELALRDREATLASVFAASPDLITIMDVDGRVRVASPALRRMLGYEPEERSGVFLPDLVHPEDRAEMEAALMTVREATEPVSMVFRYRHAEGHWVTLSVHSQALINDRGKATGIVAVTRDKTETVRLQQALRRSKEAAEQASRAKSGFLSHMSHELRTPLNAVLGFAQILEMTSQSADQREATQHILKAGKHLLHLIDEVLDIARIEAGRLTMSVEPTRPARVIQDSCDLIAPLARHYGVTLITTTVDACDYQILGDEHRLRQVLLNLLSNAVKYNHAGGTVALSCTQRPGNRLRIAVTDTGRGIPTERQSQLFIPFERLGIDHTGIEGHGIGLSLSKSLIELMGGEIGVESTLGEGSTFWVELPLAEVGAQR